MQKLPAVRVKLALAAQAKRRAWRGWFRLARTRPRQRSGWPAGKTFSTVSFWNSPHSAISSDQERYHAEGKPQRTPIGSPLATSGSLMAGCEALNSEE